MGKLFVVAKREYLERVRSRWFIISTLAIPALMTAIFAVSILASTRNGASSGVRHIAILDATGVGLGDRIAAALMADSSLRDPKTDSIRPRVQAVTSATLAEAEAAVTAEVKKPQGLVGYMVLTDITKSGLSARYAGRNA